MSSGGAGLKAHREMTLLRIQHAVPAFEAWKRAFDGDPVSRKEGGVRRYEIHRAASDPNLVVIDLHFDGLQEATAFLEKLRRLWSGPGKAVMKEPQAQIFETIESVAL